MPGDSDPAAIVQFSGDENHLFFKLCERLLLSRKLTGIFPDFERVLPPSHEPFSRTACYAFKNDGYSARNRRRYWRVQGATHA